VGSGVYELLRNILGTFEEYYEKTFWGTYLRNILRNIV
jgi:hypothetical protein